jgi:two-component system cell cycle response regulator DivK
MTAPRVLVVDDNAINIELVSYVLGADGFVVAGASDAQDALDKVALFRPHIVLMDVQMPHVDGLELTRFIRAEPSMCNVVVIAFTAYAMKGDEQKMLAAGCDGYLTKPLDVATFAASVRKYLPAASDGS